MFLGLALLTAQGCGSERDKTKGEGKTAPSAQQAPLPPVPATPPGDLLGPVPAPGGDLVAEVDGAKLTKKELDAELAKMMKNIEGKVPADKRAHVRANIRRQLRDSFIIRTLLSNEIARKKIKATVKEVDDAVAEVKANLPPNVTLDDFLKQNQLTPKKMREEIRFGIAVKKLVASQSGANPKPTDKEIKNFYEKNKEKFKMPETVHVRHILVAKVPEDTDATKADKRAKAEDLRKQLLAGADFAELAMNNSDCPSKQTGGDLGTFPRGQMVKPFEDAAFSQPLKVIGPVVETQLGYHVIQVLERNRPKTMPLDASTKEKISGIMQQKKQRDAFEALINKLKKTATIIVYEK